MAAGLPSPSLPRKGSGGGADDAGASSSSTFQIPDSKTAQLGPPSLPRAGGGLDKLAVWVAAARPATLTAAFSPVAVGTALAYHDGAARAAAAAAALLGAMFIQIGTNLVNDVEDFERGADAADRLGPRRATQTGDLGARTVRAAAALVFAVAALCGVYLTALGGWPILVLGVLSIASGIAYTAGPWPLAYLGLGDLFVFLFFGLAAVLGTYYVQVGAISGLAWLCALPIGCLATAILVVNNTRDVDTDARAGKRTLAVRCGAAAARREYVLLVATAFAAAPAVAWQLGHAAALLPLAALPRGWNLIARLFAAHSGEDFNTLLRDTGRLQILYALLLATGVILCASPG